MLLAIDTATQFAGIALFHQGEVLAEETWHARMTHSVELMPRIQRTLSAHTVQVEGLAGIGVTLGPGSYTGLRIGLAAAKGLALPHRLSLVGIPTLDAVAHPCQGSRKPVWATIQAGRGRLWAACYRLADGAWRQVVAPTLTTLDGLAEMATEPALFIGELGEEEASGLVELLGTEAVALAPPSTPARVACVAEMAAERLADNKVDDLATLAPLYLQSPDGKSPADQTPAEANGSPNRGGVGSP